ncbi:RcnB family protein [Erwinia mallotivora]|uniref:RcnB family protein n=1 Tax=Erwinia mallotivora TaxID=69222 RepID=UPI0021C18366|nr:RcnB family protein [Erwinia mallotivora]
MKKSGIIALSALLLASTSFSSFAEGPQPGQDQQQQIKRPPQGQQQNDRHNDQPQHNGQPQHEGDRRQAQHRKPQPQFRKGHALEARYRGDGYRVNDWQKHGLKAPPPGHRWQNVDGNYVLIAVATGVITSVIAHQ